MKSSKMLLTPDATAKDLEDMLDGLFGIIKQVSEYKENDYRIVSAYQGKEVSKNYHVYVDKLKYREE